MIGAAHAARSGEAQRLGASVEPLSAGMVKADGCPYQTLLALVHEYESQLCSVEVTDSLAHCVILGICARPLPTVVP